MRPGDIRPEHFESGEGVDELGRFTCGNRGWIIVRGEGIRVYMFAVAYTDDGHTTEAEASGAAACTSSPQLPRAPEFVISARHEDTKNALSVHTEGALETFEPKAMSALPLPTERDLRAIDAFGKWVVQDPSARMSLSRARHYLEQSHGGFIDGDRGFSDEAVHAAFEQAGIPLAPGSTNEYCARPGPTMGLEWYEAGRRQRWRNYEADVSAAAAKRAASNVVPWPGPRQQPTRARTPLVLSNKGWDEPLPPLEWVEDYRPPRGRRVVYVPQHTDDEPEAPNRDRPTKAAS